MNHRRIALALPLIALLVLMAVLALGVSAQEPTAAAPMNGSEGPPTYRVAVEEEQTSENVWAIYHVEDHGGNDYQKALYPGLYRFSDHGFALVPFLASGFPSNVVKQGAYWVSTVALKQGMLWSDGVEVTAADLAFTAQTARDLDLGGEWNRYHGTLHHVEVTGPHTATLFFTEAPGLATWPYDAGILPVVASHFWAPIVAQAGVQAEPADWLYAYEPVGEPTVGPFKRSAWVPGQYVEHVANPLYYFGGVEITEYANGAYHESLAGDYEFTAYGQATGPIALQYTYGPYAGRVRYTLYASQEAAAQALRDGEADYIYAGSLTNAVYHDLLGDAGVAAFSNASNGFRYLAFNLRREILDVQAFRESVGILADREAIGKDLALEIITHTAPVAWSIVPEANTFWHTPTLNVGQGLTRGQRISDTVDLLEGTGFTWTVTPTWDSVAGVVNQGDGLHRNGQPVPAMELLAPNAEYDELRATAAVSIAGWLSEAGISTTAVLTDFDTIVNKVWNETDFDMYILGWGMGTPYPSYLDGLFHSRNDSTQVDFGWNTSGYNSPAYDALCDQFMAGQDIDQARQDAYGLQAMVAQDLPYLSLYFPPLFEAYRSDSVTFPYTETIGGLVRRHGLAAAVRFVPAVEVVDTGGGTVETSGGTVEIPAGAFTDTVVVSYTVMPPSGALPSAGIFFDISAVYSDTGEAAQLAAGATFTITVGYDENTLPPNVPEQTLKLYYWDDQLQDWVAEPTSVVDTVANTITATPDHMSLWSGLGEVRFNVYLPAILKE